MTDDAPLRLDRDGPVATLTLDRPAAMNALSAALKSRLATALDALAADGEVRVVILTGAGGRAFSAGNDVKERAADTSGPAEGWVALDAQVALLRRLETLPQPVIAAIDGVAYGGGLELALACDLRLATAASRFALPEVRIGTMPAAGGTQRLPRLIGPGRAKRMILTGAPVDAETALAWGLIDEAHADRPALEAAARALAAEIAANAPAAVRLAKAALRLGAEAGPAAGPEVERAFAALVNVTEDRREGMRAFAEKRAPDFKGR